MSKLFTRIIALLVIPALLQEQVASASWSAVSCPQTVRPPLLTVSSSFASQALATEAIDEHFPLLGPEPTGKIARFLGRKLPRRQFIQTGATVAAGAARMAADVYYHEGVGETNTIKIDFVKFNPDQWKGDREANDILRIMGGHILADKIFQRSKLFRRDQVFPIEDPWPSTLDKLLERAKATLTNDVDNRALSEDRQTQWNQILYQALPRYLARRGVFFWPEATARQTVRSVEYFNHYHVFQVDDVRPIQQLPLWGAHVSFDQIHVSKEVPIEGIPPGVFTPDLVESGLVAYGNIILAENEILHQATDSLEVYQNLTDDDRAVAATPYDVYSRQQDSIDPLLYAKIQLKAVAAQNADEDVLKRHVDWLRRSTVLYQAVRYAQIIIHHRFPPGPPPTTASGFLHYKKRWIYPRNVEEILTGLRYATDEDWPLELLDLLDEYYPSEVNNTSNAARFSIIDAMITEIEFNLEDYSDIEINLKDSPLLIRDQIVSQLFRLTPAQGRRLAAIIHDDPDLNPSQLDYPDDISAESLYTEKAPTTIPRQSLVFGLPLLAGAPYFALSAWAKRKMRAQVIDAIEISLSHRARDLETWKTLSHRKRIAVANLIIGILGERVPDEKRVERIRETLQKLIKGRIDQGSGESLLGRLKGRVHAPDIPDYLGPMPLLRRSLYRIFVHLLRMPPRAAARWTFYVGEAIEALRHIVWSSANMWLKILGIPALLSAVAMNAIFAGLHLFRRDTEDKYRYGRLPAYASSVMRTVLRTALALAGTGIYVGVHSFTLSLTWSFFLHHPWWVHWGVPFLASWLAQVVYDLWIHRLHQRGKALWLPLLGSNQSARSRLFNQAHEALDQQDYQTAEWFIELGRLRYAGDSGFLQLAAQLALKRHNLIPAKQLIQQAIDLNPGNAESWDTLSRILLMEGNIDAALAANLEEIELNPHRSSAFTLRFQLFIQRWENSGDPQDLDDAITNLLTKIAFNLKNARDYEFLSRLYIQKRRFDLAVGAAEQEVDLRPEDSEAQQRLYSAYYLRIKELIKFGYPESVGRLLAEAKKRLTGSLSTLLESQSARYRHKRTSQAA